MDPVMRLLRLSFILLFGAMSLSHGPVMTFSQVHAPAAAEHAGPSHDAMPDCHQDQVPPAKHAKCNAFACLMAVEPMPVMARPLRPVVFAMMAAAPTAVLDPLRTEPALPPPRIRS
jgi:hypothetical protein